MRTIGIITTGAVGVVAAGRRRSSACARSRDVKRYLRMRSM